jgi:dTDP-4-dehydrorhamnose reductase
MTEKKVIEVVADQVGTPTSSRSLAEVIWLLTERPEVRGIQHWTDAGVASWYDFAAAIAEDAAQIGLIPRSVTVRPIRTCDYPSRTRRPSYSVLDKTALYAALDITPVHWRVRLRDVLRELANA